MKSRITPVLPLALMLFLAALTFWLQYAVQESPGEPGARRHDPDAIVENFTVHRLSDTGKPQYTFSAPKMLHFLDDNSSEALYPRIVQLDDTGGNITATANRGTITKDGEEAFLYGNVLIIREATPEHEELRARTEFLHMLSEKHIAQTDRQVTITQGPSVLTGVGMVVNEDTHEFTLQSQVKGTYDAPKRK
ncbi:MAG: LPS export ABC transporter periplasmic protein LptC [Burkholderiales bacterium]